MSLSMEERLKLAHIDPELAEVLKTAKFPEIDYSDPEKVIFSLRAYMKSQHKPADPESGVSERDIHYSARDSFELRARVYEPVTKSASHAVPLVVYIHGGGWTIGSPEDAAVPCRNLAKELGVVCVAPSYRQGPEEPFPAGINDIWDGLQWLDTHAETDLGVSLSRGFVVGGSSAGGNMAAVASHLARDKPLSNPITGLFLLAPMILPPEAAGVLPPKYADMYKSRTQPECKKDPVLTPELEKIFHDSAKGDTNSSLFVPFIWPTGHDNLPKTYFQVCGMDILRDEALIYEQVLREGGVETRLDVYPGMPHIFWNTFSQLGQGRKAAEDLRNGVKWLLD